MENKTTSERGKAYRTNRLAGDPAAFLKKEAERSEATRTAAKKQKQEEAEEAEEADRLRKVELAKKAARKKELRKQKKELQTQRMSTPTTASKGNVPSTGGSTGVSGNRPSFSSPSASGLQYHESVCASASQGKQDLSNFVGAREEGFFKMREQRLKANAEADIQRLATHKAQLAFQTANLAFQTANHDRRSLEEQADRDMYMAMGDQNLSASNKKMQLDHERGQIYREDFLAANPNALVAAESPTADTPDIDPRDDIDCYEEEKEKDTADEMEKENQAPTSRALFSIKEGDDVEEEDSKLPAKAPNPFATFEFGKPTESHSTFGKPLATGFVFGGNNQTAAGYDFGGGVAARKARKPRSEDTIATSGKRRKLG